MATSAKTLGRSRGRLSNAAEGAGGGKQRDKFDAAKHFYLPLPSSETVQLRRGITEDRDRDGTFPLFQKYLRVYYESNALFLTPAPYLRGMTQLTPSCYYVPPQIGICPPTVGSM